MTTTKERSAGSEQTLIRKIRGALTQMAVAPPAEAKPAFDVVDALLPPLFERDERTVVARLVAELQRTQENHHALDAYVEFMDLGFQRPRGDTDLKLVGLIVRHLDYSLHHELVLLESARIVERSLAHLLRLPLAAVRCSPHISDATFDDPDADYLDRCRHALALHDATPPKLRPDVYNRFTSYEGAELPDDAPPPDQLEDGRSMVLLLSIRVSDEDLDYGELLQRIDEWADGLTVPFAIPYQVGRDVHAAMLFPHAAHAPFAALHEASYLEEQTFLEDTLLEYITAPDIVVADLVAVIAPVAPPKAKETIEGARVTLWSKERKLAIACCDFDFARNPALLIERLVEVLKGYGVAIAMSKQPMAPTFCAGCGEPHCVTPTGALTHAHRPHPDDIH